MYLELLLFFNEEGTDFLELSLNGSLEDLAVGICKLVSIANLYAHQKRPQVGYMPDR